MANNKKVVKEAKISSTKDDKKSKEMESKKEAENNIQVVTADYGKAIISCILILLLLIGGFFTYKYYNNRSNNKEKVKITEDEKRFKEEYETLNNTTRNDGTKVKSIEIMEDNNITYVSLSEAVEILEDGSGVIYFGFAACPWCRNAITELLKAMSNTSLETIYYVDVRPDDDSTKDIRDLYELNNHNKPFIKREKTKAYDRLLTLLASELEDYVLVTESGKKVPTGEKRLYAPTVVAVVNGEIVGFHEGTFEDHQKNKDGILADLNKKQQEELTNIYVEIISDFLGEDCDADTEGC